MPTLTILVVDDETDVQHLFPVLFRRQIRKKQYQFLFAASGQEALDLLNQYPAIDLMLCDIDMPSIEITTRLVKAHIYIFIRDNGTGISLEVLTDIFKPFFTTKRLQRAMLAWGFLFLKS